MRLLYAFAVLTVVGLVSGSERGGRSAPMNVALVDSSWRTPEADRAALHVPPGFEVQLVAAEPEIDKPMNLAFDARGRLWVTHSREYPIAAAPGAGRDRVSILEDTNADGRADERRVLYGPFDHDDTHGMVNSLLRSYDGWIHAGHGFSNRSTVAGTDGDSIRMTSGNTFRFRDDGSRVEQLTWGA